MNVISFINTNKAWGGGEKWHFEMAKSLRKNGHQVHMICYPESDLAKKCQENDIPYTTFKTSNLSFLNPFKIFSLRKLILTLDIQAAFLNLPIDAKIMAIVKIFTPKIKLVYRRGMPHPIRPSFINKFVYKKIDRIIANSLEIKKSISHYLTFLEKKTTIIYNGVIPQNIDPSPLNIHRPKFILGNLGRLTKQKGQHHLVKIAQHLKKMNFSFEILIAGQGELADELKELIKNYKLEEDIKLVGQQSPDAFFKKIDLFIFTSHFEGSANALIESMQFGIPAICFNTSSMPEVIEDGKEGFLITPFDEFEFAHKIYEVLSNQDIYQQMKQASLNKITDRFDYRKKIIQVEELLNEL